MREIPFLLNLISEKLSTNHILKNFVYKSLMILKTDQLNFYLYEIFQLLNTKVYKLIQKFFLDFAQKSPLFSHQLIWQCRVEEKAKPEEDRRYEQNEQKRFEATQLVNKIMRNFTEHDAKVFNEVDTFVTTLTEISSKMQPAMPKEEKIQVIRANVEKIKIPKYAYLPTNPHMRVVEINRDSGRPMQSAAKCPFLLSFRCEEVHDIDSLMREDTRNSKNVDFAEMEEGDKRIEVRSLKVNFSHTATNRTQTNKNLRHNGSNMSVTKSNMKLQNFDNISFIAEKLKDKYTRPSQRIISKVDRNFDSILLGSDKSFTINKNADEKKRAKPLTTIACIFKTKDDIRNDTVTLKFMTLLKEVFDQEKVELYLKPYRTYSNRTGAVS